MCLLGLHITQGIFQKLFGLLEEACHELDLKLASCHHSSEHHGSFTPYTVALQDLNKTKADLDVAQQSANILEQLMVYSSVVLGKENPLVQGLLKQCDESRKNVQELVILSI